MVAMRNRKHKKTQQEKETSVYIKRVTKALLESVATSSGKLSVSLLNEAVQSVASRYGVPFTLNKDNYAELAPNPNDRT